MTHSVAFTLLPSGVIANASRVPTLRLSVLVSPRLDPSTTTLTGTPFADWPSVVKQVSFQVLFGTPNNTKIARLDPDPSFAAGRFDSALWTKLFASVAVAPVKTTGYESSAIASYNTKNAATSLKAAYMRAATSPARPKVFPIGTSDALSMQVHGVASAVSSAPALATNLRASTAMNANGTPRPNISSDKVAALGVAPAYQDFTRAAVHYDYRQCRTGQPPAADAPVPSPPPLSADFHKIVTQLADHPALLRRLGLLFDLLVDPDPSFLHGAYSVSVEPMGVASGQSTVALGADRTLSDPSGHWKTSYVRPWSQCAVSATEFKLQPLVVNDPANPASPLRALLAPNGQLQADDAAMYYLDDLDVDHATTQFVTFAGKTSQDVNSSNVAAEVAMPALRTAGFSLHQSEREKSLRDKLIKTYEANNDYYQNQNPSAAAFYAEDMLRGYRVDVSVKGPADAAFSPWKSLCRRTSTLTIEGYSNTPLVVPDEGYVKASALSTSPTAFDGTGTPVHVLHESLFHWDGWSLAAQRPGMSLLASPSAPGVEQKVAPVSSGLAALNVPLTTSIAAQPGLPLLRFGRSYMFRVRAVDLAGNDMGHGASASPSATDKVTQASTFRRYEPVASPTFVLRRPVTEGESVDHLVIRSDPFATVPLDAVAWAKKHSPAPSGDASAPLGMNPYSATCERHVAPPKTSFHLAEYHGMFDGLFKDPAHAWRIAVKEEGTFFDNNVVDSSVSSASEHVQPKRAIVTPDAAREADGKPPKYTGNAVIQRGDSLANGQYITFDTDEVMIPYLPDPLAAGITIQGLPVATTRSFRPRASGGAWPEYGIFRLVLQSAPTGQGFSVTGADAAGGAPAALTELCVNLPPGTLQETTISSTVVNPAHLAFAPPGQLADVSAGKIPTLSPSRKVRFVHAVQRPRARAIFDADLHFAPRSVGDTSLSISGTLAVDGTTAGHLDFVAAWDEYVDSARTPPVDPSVTPIPHKGTLASFTVSYDQGAAVLPTNLKQTFGDTKRRNVHYRTVATTRYREYFPASITADTSNITAESPDRMVIVPATARPRAPKVLYVVPSFRWTESADKKTRTRVGGGLRVYVDRGWYSSGEDERLAVILADSSLSPAAASGMSHLGSQWGQDPVWMPKSGGLAKLDQNAFVTGEVFNNVPLAEPGYGGVTVVTFKPAFNLDRQLWYFDIELNASQLYFPFVRLALARYQPQAVGGLNMSTVVLAQFAQLAADRTASVIANGAGSFTVSVSGPLLANMKPTSTPVSAQQAAPGHYVTAEFQTARTDGVDDLDWTTSGATTLLDPQLTGAAVGFQKQLSFTAPPGKKARVLVKEYEIYEADTQANLGTTNQALHAGTGEAPRSTIARLVYADAIGL